PWQVDSSLLSAAEADDSVDLETLAEHITAALGIAGPAFEDREAVQILAQAIGLRSARLAAAAISSVIIWSGRLAATDDAKTIDIGVDGSLVEHYPNYEAMIRTAMREVPEIGADGERRVTVGVAKDGSGVGAALGAVVATRGRR
ncbi:glucokinase, partial [Ascosphaera acerosa]